MTENDVQRQPIGYWLNRTDQALTARMNELLAADGLTRVGWQILNVLAGAGPLPAAQVYAQLQANASPDTLSDTMAELALKGWVQQEQPSDDDTPSVCLTADGQAAHASLHERIGQFRQRSLQHISPAEYATAIRVLQQIVSNLD